MDPWSLFIYLFFPLKCNQVSLHTHSGRAEPVWAWSCWRRTPKSSLRSRLLNPQQVLFTSAENALNLLVLASPPNSKTLSWLLFAPLPPPDSASFMAALCGAGATIAWVLLALIGAVVCSRTSKPTTYTVCSWCEAIKNVHAYFSPWFFFVLFNILSIASDTLHHKSISNKTNFVMNQKQQN